MAKKKKIDWFHADSFGGRMPMTNPACMVDTSPNVPNNGGSFDMNDGYSGGNKGAGGLSNGSGFGGNDGGYNNGGFGGGYNGGMQAPNQYNINVGGQPGGAGSYTPMVQPLVLVPYSSPSQPLYHYPDGTLPIGDIDSSKMQQLGIPNGMPNMSMNMPMPNMPDMLNMQNTHKKKKKKQEMQNYSMNRGFPYVIGDREDLSNVPQLNVKSLLLMIFTFLSVLLCGLGHFASHLPDVVCWFINITPETGYDIVGRLVQFFTTGTFINLDTGAYIYIAFTFAVMLVFEALVFLFALFSIVRKQTALFVKILVSILLAVTIILFTITAITMSFASVGYGMYILLGFSLVMFLLAIIEKKKK